LSLSKVVDYEKNARSFFIIDRIDRGLVFVSLRANLRARKASEAVEKLSDVSTGGADMQLKKIRFGEDKQGQKTWELEAESVQQYQEQNMMVLEDVKVTYAKEGRIIYLTGKQERFIRIRRT